MDSLKQRSDMASFMFFEDEACSTILNMLKAMERGSRQTSKERLAVVEAQQNE